MKKKALLILVLAALVVGGVFAQNRSEPNDDSDFKFNKSNGTITGYLGTDKRCVVPSEIDGRPVAAIGNSAFQHNKIVTEVVLPPSVISIGNNAFENSNLQYISVQGKLKSIGTNAFKSTNLKNFISAWPSGSSGIIKVPNGLHRDSALSGALVIPDGVTAIGEYAFANTQITSVTLPRTINSIGNSAFGDCKQLTTVTIPSSVTKITFAKSSFGGDYALYTAAPLNAASKKALLDRGAPATERAFK